MANKIFVKAFDEPEESRRKKAESLLADFCRKHNPSEGEKAIEAIHCYRILGLSPPDWALEVLVDAVMIFKTGREYPAVQVTKESFLPITRPKICLSLDEALGLKRRTEKSVSAAIKKRELAMNVYRNMVEEKRKGNPIDENTFELIGKKLHISGSLARKYYYGLLKEGYPSLSGRQENA